MKQLQECEKLTAIAEGIIKCKRLIDRRKEDCQLSYGLTDSGKLRTNQFDLNYIAKYYAISLRLKLYYNNCLAKMTPYKTIQNEQTN